MRLRRSVVVSGFAAVGSVVLATSAWAWCTPYNPVTGQSPAAGVMPNRAPAGTVITVRATNWAAGPVEIHWASASGATLASPVVASDGGDVTVGIRIPESSAPGRSALVVVQGASQITAPLVVLEASAAPGTDPDQQASTEASANAPSLAPTGAASGGTGAIAPASSADPAATGATGGATAPSGAGGIPLAPGSAPAAGAIVAQRTSRVTPAVPAHGEPAVVATGRPVGEAQAPAPAADPARRSAVGDLWSGFATADAGSGLVPSPATPAAGVPVGAAAAGLLVGGLVALSGGFAVAERRRRTAAVVAVPTSPRG